MKKTKSALPKTSEMFVIEKLIGNCTFQDLGRTKAQHLGFSSGGAADEHAYRIANHLLQNHINSSAFELRFSQITLRCIKAFNFALTGAESNATINENPINNWQKHHLTPDDTLTLSLPPSGLITYLAFDFPIAIKKFLGSCSQTTNEKSLGLFAPLIQSGDIFHQLNRDHGQENINDNKENKHEEAISSTTAHSVLQNITNVPPFAPLRFYGPLTTENGDKSADKNDNELILRFLPSDQYLALSRKEKQHFLKQIFTISSQSNRMGYRLTYDAPNLLSEKSKLMLKRNKLSKPVSYGTIQLPVDNNPIVLMKDRQTIGGYPVLGNVMQTDLFRLAQKRPGEHVRFVPTTLVFAQQQLASFRKKWG